MYFLSGVACNFWRDGTKCGRPNSLFLYISFPFISFIQSFMYLFHTCSQTWRWACENDGLFLSPISRTKGDITSAHQHCLYSYGVMNKWQILQDFFFCLKKCCVLKKITVWYMSYVLFLLSDLRVFVSVCLDPSEYIYLAEKLYGQFLVRVMLVDTIWIFHNIAIKINCEPFIFLSTSKLGCLYPHYPFFSEITQP